MHLEDNGREQVAKAPAKDDGDIEDGNPGCARERRCGIGEGGVDAQVKGDRATTQTVERREEQIFGWKTLKRMRKILQRMVKTFFT